MVTHTSLVEVWLAPLDGDLPAHRVEGALTVVIRGPYTFAMTAIVGRRDPRADAGHQGSARPEPATTQFDAHVSAGPEETDPRLLSVADVIVRRAGSGRPEPRSLSGIRARFPGCLVAAVIDRDRTCVWAGDPGRQFQFVSLPETRPSEPKAKRQGSRADEDLLCCASVIHAWLVAGRPLAELDAAHLMVSRGPAPPRHGVRVSLMYQERRQAAEESSRQVGC